ncbi:MAG: HAD family hydrolase [Clostridia bacterium]|nr:HAD family hydrolase [Clostridia bacterium]
MYKVIVFDIGDTLIGYEPDSITVITRRFDNIGIKITAEEAAKINQTMELGIAKQIYREINGAERLDDAAFIECIDRQILALPFVRAKINTAELEKAFKNAPIREKQNKIVKPNAHMVLQELKKKYRLGVISNYSASMLDYLHEADLADYFETIVISEIVGFEKPDPKIYECFLQQMGCAAKDCLYVGDHPFDVMGAKRAGMDVVWLNQIYNDMPEYIHERPDYILRDIGELISIL